jgi:predicted transcriptional regulator
MYYFKDVMSTTSFRLDDDLQLKLDETAARLNRSKGWIINNALRQYIKQEERKLQMLKEAQEAIADIQEGRVVSGEEVKQWLETWGTGNETKPPIV